ncbi:MAG TPA: YciI family protein [Bauldia sp.]|nr:YciI family protein [Bauldia sp.]
MKFLCLVYMEPNVFDPFTPAEQQAMIDDSLEYDVRLRRDGHFISADALQPATTAKTVRVRNGKSTVTDGPFAETREVLGGFVLIEAKDMEEAIRLAAGIPSARVGSIEVRPILQLSHS